MEEDFFYLLQLGRRTISWAMFFARLATIVCLTLQGPGFPQRYSCVHGPFPHFPPILWWWHLSIDFEFKSSDAKSHEDMNWHKLDLNTTQMDTHHHTIAEENGPEKDNSYTPISF